MGHFLSDYGSSFLVPIIHTINFSFSDVSEERNIDFYVDVPLHRKHLCKIAYDTIRSSCPTLRKFFHVLWIFVEFKTCWQSYIKSNNKRATHLFLYKWCVVNVIGLLQFLHFDTKIWPTAEEQHQPAIHIHLLVHLFAFLINIIAQNPIHNFYYTKKIIFSI